MGPPCQLHLCLRDRISTLVGKAFGSILAKKVNGPLIFTNVNEGMFEAALLTAPLPLLILLARFMGLFVL